MKIKTMSYKYSKNTLTIPKKSEVKKYIQKCMKIIYFNIFYFRSLKIL